jgi:hypothetical protein
VRVRARHPFVTRSLARFFGRNRSCSRHRGAFRLRLWRLGRLRRRRRRGSRRGGSRRDRCGRRRRGRSSRAPPRKERQGVDVGVAVADPDAEVQVREVVFGVARRTRFRDGAAFGHVLSFVNEKRPEVSQRGFVSVGSRDRDGLSVRGNESRERHLACCGRTNLASAGKPDVDSTMLAGCVGIGPDGELAQYRAICRPGPGECSRRRHESNRSSQRPEESGTCCLLSQHDGQRSEEARRLSNRTTVKPCRARSEPHQ